MISKFNKGFRFLLCVIDIYSRYAWVIPLKDKKGITITDAFQKILQESNKKPNKICFDKGSEFYNRSTKSWLERTKENEGESVIAERFIKINKYMTSVSQNVYIDKLGDIVNKYNNTYHSKIKIKPVDVKSNAYIDTSKEINDKNPKFINGDLLKYQNVKTFLQKAALQKGLKKFLWLKKLKILCRKHILLVILKEKKLLKRFTKKNYKRQTKKSLQLKT